MSSYSHAEDVLGFARARLAAGEACALAVVSHTQGGGLRWPGAMMAVTRDGTAAGYVSNGCVDADVIGHALAAIETGKADYLVYGAGSPFMDIRLPCGGQMDVLVAPLTDPDAVARTHDALTARTETSLTITRDGKFTAGPVPADRTTSWDGDTLSLHLTPKLALRVAGRGEEAIALARLAAAGDFATTLQSPDDHTLARARAEGLTAISLTTAQSLPGLTDDPWTAFALLFHDQDWEIPLLLQTFDGPAFWIGAVGSRRTHQLRCEALTANGARRDQIARLQGPIGLIPRTRDASMLAVSTLAEIASAYKDLTA
ncbi:XdhC family protein [Pyruvatibacter mobilis]|uniref:XdhC family protein n=1 Tax=Pyruvatibacter mobilis TaxID=1712261 RepID=UPI003BAA58DA